MSIILEGVSKSFGERRVLQNVNLTLPDRGAVCFFGPSGCGKTTLTRLICGLERPDAGHIRRPEGLRFSCHFQEDRLLPWYTAEENLTLALGSREQAQMWLEQTGLADAGALYPGELSGGMRRRVSWPGAGLSQRRAGAGRTPAGAGCRNLPAYAGADCPQPGKQAAPPGHP